MFLARVFLTTGTTCVLDTELLVFFQATHKANALINT